MLTICSCFLLTGCSWQNKSELSVSSFEEILKQNNITYSKLNEEKPREGIKETYYFYFDDETMLNLYVFDTKSDLYKQVKKDGTMNNTDIGGEFFVTLNKNLAISFEGDSKYKALITEKFEALK